MNIEQQGKGQDSRKNVSQSKSLLIAVLLAAALAGAGLWQRSHGVQQPAPVSVAATSQGTQAQMKEIAGTFTRIDLAGQLQKYKDAKSGSQERKVFEEASAYSSETSPARKVLEQALSETAGPVVVVADTSGSMGSDVAKVAVTNQYLSGISASRSVTAIYVDDQVRGVEQLAVGYSGVAVGGGATSYKPAFAFLQEKAAKPGLLIYITDGECSDFPFDPGYPVLWLLVRPSGSFNPSFGVVAGR